MRDTIPNRIIFVLCFPLLLMVVGIWQLAHILSRFRAWFSKHVLG